MIINVQTTVFRFQQHTERDQRAFYYNGRLGNRSSEYKRGTKLLCSYIKQTSDNSVLLYKYDLVIKLKIVVVYTFAALKLSF